MNLRWIVGGLGVVTTVTWLQVPFPLSMEAHERERYREWWMDMVEKKVAICREWAEVAERCAGFRVSYASMFGAYCCYSDLSPEEQARLRTILTSRTVPLGKAYGVDACLDGGALIMQSWWINPVKQ